MNMGSNSMITIAVCDSERSYRNKIFTYINNYMQKHCQDYKIDVYNTGMDLLSAVEKGNSYHIIFLDVYMGKISGIDIAKKIQEYIDGLFLVFVSAYSEYASEGYKINVFRFIEKWKNIEKEINECMHAFLDRCYVALPSRMFEFREGIIKIPLSNILYIESDLHFLNYYVMGEKLIRYTKYGKLNDIEVELPEGFFIRIHQSYLVNVRYIKLIKEQKVILKNGIGLSVSRPRYKRVKELFEKNREAL